MLYINMDEPNSAIGKFVEELNDFKVFLEHQGGTATCAISVQGLVFLKT